MSQVGSLKRQFCNKLGQSHHDLADYFDIKRRNQWEKGRECWSILEWLEERGRLNELQEALVEIEREDLIGIIQPLQYSNPLNQFFEVPPTEVKIQNLNQDDIVEFFKGYSDSWTPVQSGIALSRRLKPESGDSISLNEFVKKLISDSALKFVKIFGAGGSGKTTFSRMLALELTKHQSSSTIFLRNLEPQRVPKDEIQHLAQKLNKNNQKLFLIYDNPIRSYQVSEVLTLANTLKNENNTVMITLEREDEWLAAYEQERGRSQRKEQTYFLEEQLHSDEIEQLCQTIEKLQSEHQNIHILSGDRNINDFRQSLMQGNQRVLLAAMYEATTGEKIEETIINEFDGIPNEDGKRLYEFICGLTFYSIQFPYELARVLYATNKLKDIKRKQLAGIIHQDGGMLFARHKTIAEILWLKRNPDPETEMATLAEFLGDIKYAQGRRVGIDLKEFFLQVFNLLKNHPRLQPISIRYLSEIIDAFSTVNECELAADLYLRAGRYFEQQGDRRQAITQYEKGIQKFPRSDIFVILSKALLKQEDSQKAISVLREGIQKVPDHSVYIALSQALLRRENGLDEAISVLREGIQKVPYHGVYIALSQALLRRENGLDEAISVLREGIQKVSSGEVYIALSKTLLLRENGLDEAISVLREGIQKVSSGEVYIALSKTLLLRENGLDEAISVLREGIQKVPYHGVYIALSQALLLRENGLDEAISVLREGIQKFPIYNVYITLSQALLLRENGLDEAISVLREGIHKFPTHDVYIALSKTLLLRENGLDEAISVLREGIQKVPDHSVYIALSKTLLLRENGLDEAISVLREGIQKVPDHSVYIALSKTLLLRENGLDEAISVLREGIQKVPSGDVYIALSKTLLLQENRE